MEKSTKIKIKTIAQKIDHHDLKSNKNCYEVSLERNTKCKNESNGFQMCCIMLASPPAPIVSFLCHVQTCALSLHCTFSFVLHSEIFGAGS